MNNEQSSRLIKKIERKAGDIDFFGVISIFHKEESLYNKAFGFRDVKNRILNNTSTRFGIASGTKLFTALGIGVLIDQNKLTLDTKINSLGNEYKGFIDENATIEDLLSHRSGIYDYFDEEEIEDFENYEVDIPWFKLETPTDYLPLFLNKQMKFKANERFSYSNGGYVFLGILIERISGEVYRDFIEKNVLDPADMNNSGFFSFNNLPGNTADGYHENKTTTNIYDIPIRGGGDGGMYTTTKDLQSFWKNLFSYKIISENLTKKYLKTRSEFNEKNGYGLGIYKKLDDSMYYIVGGDSGVGFDSRYLVNDELTINILCNVSDGEEEIRKVIIDFVNSNK